MICFYYRPTPNPAKIALLLEESGKVPAIVDLDGLDGRLATVFDSTAILIYRAEKIGNFLGQAEDPLAPYPNIKRRK